MMKFFSAIAIFFVVSISVSAQGLPGKSDSSGITILQKRWFVARDEKALNSPLFSADEDSQPPPDIFEASGRIKDPKTKVVNRTVVPTQPPSLPPVQIVQNSTGKYYYGYEAKIRNDSKKTIKEIVWEYVFLDAATKQEIGRREFTSRETIRAGREKKLTQRSTMPPTGAINVTTAATDKSITNQYVGEVKIKSIKYSDGSIWQPQI